jgi:predicted alpha/beta superfamily hydrolase
MILKTWLNPLAICLLALPLAASVAHPRRSPSIQQTPLDHLPALKGDYFKLQSRSVGRPYHIYVRLPESYAADPRRRYPVVYLLDGDSLFPMLAVQHLFLGYDEQLPEAIIVGIAYGSFDPAVNRRSVDFQAPAAGVDAEKAGAPAFQQFLRSELLPAVEARYRTDPERRVLVGQSRGGSFVLYSAFTDPDLFWGRIASNPAFDPGRELFLGRPAAASKQGLGLVVTSGSRDRPALRQAALQWFNAWEKRADAPWQIKAHSIEGGTHAADIANAYRVGMLWLHGAREDAAAGRAK